MSTNFLQTERFVQLKNYQTEVFFCTARARRARFVQKV
jgi:hypothetical protein